MINKKAKWERDRNKNVAQLSSDIITNCLKTKDETLSLWYLKDDTCIDDAIVALSSCRDFVQKLDYIIIPDDYIKKYSLQLDKKSGGDSPYEKFNNNHCNVINVNYELLGCFSEMILDLMKNNVKIKRVNEKVIGKKLSDFLKKGLLNKKMMKESLVEEIPE